MLKRMKPAGERKAARHREERLKATGPHQAWSMDFVTDQLRDGTKFRSLPERRPLRVSDSDVKSCLMFRSIATSHRGRLLRVACSHRGR